MSEQVNLELQHQNNDQTPSQEQQIQYKDIQSQEQLEEEHSPNDQSAINNNNQLQISNIKHINDKDQFAEQYTEEHSENLDEQNKRNIEQQSLTINNDQNLTRYQKAKQIINKFLAVFVCLFWASACVSMTLLNKIILNQYNFSNPNLMILWQNLVTTLILLVQRKCGSAKFQFEFRIAKKWIIVNILFVFFLSTSAYALEYLPVPMITVFKNIAVICLAFGDKYFFKANLSFKIKIALFMMFLGSLSSAYTDLSFTLIGYIFMGLHTLSNTVYILYIRKLRTEISLTEHEQVFYNNVLSLPFFIILAFLDGEWQRAINYDHWLDPGFIVVWIVSGILGMLISWSSFLTLNMTGPTTYGFVGSLNKIPLTILGYLLFDVQVNLKNVLSISFGISAGIFYSLAKLEEQKKSGNQGGGRH